MDKRAMAPMLVMVLLSCVRVAAQNDYQPIDFGKLSDFEYELPDPLDPSAKPPQNVIPAAVKALNGKRIAVRGFMLPLDLDKDGVSQFILNATIDMCYFGAPVRMNEWVMVKMKSGKARFTHTPIDVQGTFSVGEEVKDGRVVSLYRLDADSANLAR